MRIIKPIVITDATLLSSNVAETDAPAWSSGTSYAVGAEVMENHVVYRAATANTNKDPEDIANRTIWPIVGASNRWKMFDMTRGTEIQTINSDSIEVIVRPGVLYSSLALFGIYAQSVQVEIIDGSNGVVFDQTYSLQSSTGVTSYFQWFYTPPSKKTQFVTLDLPYYSDATVRVTVSSPGSTVKVGKLVLGFAQELGCTAFGTNVRFLDFSRRDRDDFGNLVKVERRKVSERTYKVHVDSDRLLQVENVLKSLNSTPTVFVGSPNHEISLIFGLPIDFSSDYAYKKSDYSLKVQEY